VDALPVVASDRSSFLESSRFGSRLAFAESGNTNGPEPFGKALLFLGHAWAFKESAETGKAGSTIAIEQMKKFTAEFLRTFALVFAGTGAIVTNDVAVAPLRT
jgi:hypothetical protein